MNYKKYKRVFMIVMDSLGIGAMDDAKKFDDDKDILDKNTAVLEEHLQIGNFGGFPSITIPDGFVNHLPVGINITGNCYEDSKVLNIAYALESTMPYKNQVAKEEN